MSDTLRERVAEAMWQAESLRAVGQRRVIKWEDAGPPTWDQWYPLADAAIALIRGEVLEEAARTAAWPGIQYRAWDDVQGVGLFALLPLPTGEQR